MAADSAFAVEAAAAGLLAAHLGLGTMQAICGLARRQNGPFAPPDLVWSSSHGITMISTFDLSYLPNL